MIRAATQPDAYGIARVHVDSWRTTYRGTVPDAYLDSLTYERRQAFWETKLYNPDSPTHVYVAVEDNGETVGFASVGRNERMYLEYRGELQTIYLLQEHQRKGLGSALFQAAAADLLGREIRSMLLWVFFDNPARRFYEAKGGKLLGEKQFEVGGATIREVAYGWQDLSRTAQTMALNRITP